MGPFDRHPADDYEPDRGETWWDDRARMEDMLPRGGEDEVPVLLRCPVCFKDLRARELCAACGDEDGVERDGPDAGRSCPRSEGSSVSATTRRGTSFPGPVPVSLSAREEAA